MSFSIANLQIVALDGKEYETLKRFEVFDWYRVDIGTEVEFVVNCSWSSHCTINIKDFSQPLIKVLYISLFIALIYEIMSDNIFSDDSSIDKFPRY